MRPTAPCNLISNRLTCADPLSEVQGEADAALVLAQNAGFGPCVDIVMTQLGFIRSLRGLTQKLGSFFVAAADEEQFETQVGSNPSFVGCWYWIRKLQTHFYRVATTHWPLQRQRRHDLFCEARTAYSKRPTITS